MSNDIEARAFSIGFWTGVLIATGVSVIICIALQFYNVRQGYIEACKDFYDGKLKYELKELPGGEKQWIKKENSK